MTSSRAGVKRSVGRIVPWRNSLVIARIPIRIANSVASPADCRIERCVSSVASWKSFALSIRLAISWTIDEEEDEPEQSEHEPERRPRRAELEHL